MLSDCGRRGRRGRAGHRAPAHDDHADPRGGHHGVRRRLADVSRRDQDWNAALAAAEAGLDDYLFRLNENDQYYLYGQRAVAAPCNVAAHRRRPTGRRPPVVACSRTRPTSRASATSVDTSSLVTGRDHRHGDREAAASRGRSRRRSAARRSSTTCTSPTTRPRTPPRTPAPVHDYTPRRPRRTARSATTRAGHRRPRRLRRRTPTGTATAPTSCSAAADTINGPLHSNDAHPHLRQPELQRQRDDELEPTTGTSGQNARGLRIGTDVQPVRRPEVRGPLTMPPSNVAIKAERTARGGRVPLHRTDRHHPQLRWHDDGRQSFAARSPIQQHLGLPERQRPPANLPTNGVIYVQNVPPARQPELHRCASNLRTRGHRPHDLEHPLGHP